MARIKIEDLNDAKLSQDEVERIVGGAYGDGSVRSVSPSVSDSKPICYLHYKLER